jgi:hypothetical protein
MKIIWEAGREIKPLLWDFPFIDLQCIRFKKAGTSARFIQAGILIATAITYNVENGIILKI